MLVGQGAYLQQLLPLLVVDGQDEGVVSLGEVFLSQVLPFQLREGSSNTDIVTL